MNRLDDVTHRKYTMNDSFKCDQKSDPFNCDSRKKRGLPAVSSHDGIDPDSPRRSFRRYFSDDVTTTRSISTNPANHSASPVLSIETCYSKGTESSETLSLQSTSSASGGTPRYIAAALRRSPRARRQAARYRRNCSGNGPGRPVIRPNPGSGVAKPALDPVGGVVSPRKTSCRRGNEHSRSLSDPIAISSPVSNDTTRLVQLNTQHQNPISELENKRNSTEVSGHEEQSVGETHSVAGGTKSPEHFQSLETYYTYTSIEERWNDEVHAILGGLAMMEAKCAEICKTLSESQEEISHQKWENISGLHRTLLSEHHDFYVAYHHPVASSIVMGLAERYQVPARMWNIGIFGLLRLQSTRHPDSLEHMLTFIYHCYSLLTLLLETAPKFERIWIECLGDLARFRMALEVADSPEYDLWSGISRYWYNKAADRSAENGRIQHHLAVLSRRDIVQRLFFYTKALVSVQAFPEAKGSILLLFNSPHGSSKPNQDQVAKAFVGVHGQLFTRGATDEALMLAGHFLSNLEIYIGRMGAAFRLQGVYIMSSNFAAIFEYGQADALFPAEFSKPTEPTDPHNPIVSSHAAERRTPECRLESVESYLLASMNTPHRSQVVFSSSFTFQTFTVVLDQIGNKNVYPTVHITLAFIWCLASTLDTIRYIEAFVPWSNLAIFLNTLIRDDTDFRVIESECFPLPEGRNQVPEDFCIRGLSWSRNYYPPDFFKQNPEEDDGRWVEMPSLNVSRAYRCLWLGVRIAEFNRWLAYDSASRMFSATPFALELEKLSRKYNLFSNYMNKALKATEFDEEMDNV
ncbi:hypothetical protein PHISCL_05654 [Aspergillus sclerotialis]|uniref:Uncharacterized protein n=1 Tax=Aspergillus sclerotialis TaxID=2070753 RepID=A0A3A2ZFN0_9EURO|nr:hypothetical protein PHISCL_05654 [Aspergillus sclerotialis]